MTEGLTGWETTRLLKHFVLLDFMADRTVYRCGRPLPFEKIWNDEHDALARDLCNALLEPLIACFCQRRRKIVPLRRRKNVPRTWR